MFIKYCNCFNAWSFTANCKLIFLLCIQYRLFGVFPPSHNVLENIANLSYLRQLFVCYFGTILKAKDTGHNFCKWLFLRRESHRENNRIYESRFQSNGGFIKQTKGVYRLVFECRVYIGCYSVHRLALDIARETSTESSSFFRTLSTIGHLLASHCNARTVRENWPVWSRDNTDSTLRWICKQTNCIGPDGQCYI